MIIDTHLHIVDQSALRYPWLAGAPALTVRTAIQHDLMIAIVAIPRAL